MREIETRIVRAELVGATHTSAELKQTCEARLLELLCGAFNGAQHVAPAYCAWIRADALAPPAPHYALVAKVRWEQALAKAAWTAGELLPAQDYRAFFILHLV